MKVVCEQYVDGIQVGDDVVIPELVGVGRCGESVVERNGETPNETLERKLLGAKYHGWNVERTKDGFHAWKLYSDGDGTPDRPNRKDRYFRIVE